jgi:SAM-dependent methyltransferase
MHETDILTDVVDYYEGKLAAFGATPRGVDWKDEASQTVRFEQLVRALGVDERDGRGTDVTLLDFGCGYGALLTFLRQRGYECAYVGYDRSPQMILEAQRLHEGATDAVFTSDWNTVVPAGYVVASGIFNVRLGRGVEEWRDYTLRTLAELDAKAVDGWAANFLTSYSDEDRQRPDLYYADPAAIFGWCKRSASRWVSLFHDYNLYEFTIGVTRHPR